MENIVLIGFMGAGKTVVGKKLAACLGRRFVDTDREIEKVTGRSISNIFARLGAVRFRSEENLLVKKLAGKSGLVISTGGGMVLNPVNVELLKKNGILILLYAHPAIIYERVKKKKDRPLLMGGDLKDNIEKLLAEREKVYKAAADYMVDTSMLKVTQVVEKIISILESRVGCSAASVCKSGEEEL